MTDNTTSMCMNGSTANTTASAAIILLPLSITTFTLNMVTFIILQRSKKLRENNFIRLLLWLSTSNMVLSFTSCITIGNTFLQLQCINIQSLCFVTCMVTSIALSCSLIQVLFICIERLFATVSLIKGSTWSSWYNAVFVTVLVCDATYVSAVYFAFGDKKSSSCKLIDIFGEKYWYYKLFLPLLNLTILVMISIVYGVVFYRLNKRMLSIAPFTGPSTNSASNSTNITHINSPLTQNTVKSPRYFPSTNVNIEIDHVDRTAMFKANTHQDTLATAGINGRLHGVESRIKRFRRSLSTLIIVIITMYVCILPSVVTNIASALTTGQIPDNILEFTSICILLNPLVDPIVYVLRIKDFRSKLRCRNVNH